MAIAGLAFRPRFGTGGPKDVPGGVVLRGECEWLVEGGEAEIAVLIGAAAGLGVKVSAQSAILTFGNVVGTFDLGPLGAVRVVCGKWGEDVFDALLDDLTHRALALPYSATQVAGLPHDRSIADRDDVLLHAFIYARHILLGAGRVLPRALELVVRDPHRRFSAERASVELINARRVDGRTIARVAMGADGVVRATGHAAHSALARALHGHVPAYVDVPRVENTFDTAENRFVLEFLMQLRGIVDRVECIARSKAKPASFWTRALADCEAMRRVLGPFERHDMWNDVGRMGHVPMGSSVLQRRRGYKDILRHHLTLRAAARIPFDRTTVEKLLGLKDVASLYELWCYFAVVDAVADIVGRRPDHVDAMNVRDEVDLGHGFRVGWSDGPTVYYNLSFTPKTAPPRRSASLWLRPDVVIDVVRDGRRELHALDAKLRIDGVIPDANEEGEDDHIAADASPLSFKNADIAKMHAYRDALPHVRSARVLYPGNEAREFPSLDADAREGDGVGAIPLVPGQPRADLDRILTRILNTEMPSMMRDRRATPTEPSAADLVAVAGLLEQIEAIEAKPAEWGGGKQADGSIQMPFAIYEPAVDRLARAVYDYRLFVEYDWPSWQAEAERFLDPEAVRAASLDEVRRLLTLHVRKERFVEGHLAEMISGGHIASLLRRLRELADPQSS